jgi:hypothetical protein
VSFAQVFIVTSEQSYGQLCDAGVLEVLGLPLDNVLIRPDSHGTAAFQDLAFAVNAVPALADGYVAAARCVSSQRYQGCTQ